VIVRSYQSQTLLDASRVWSQVSPDFRPCRSPWTITKPFTQQTRYFIWFLCGSNTRIIFSTVGRSLSSGNKAGKREVMASRPSRCVHVHLLSKYPLSVHPDAHPCRADRRKHHPHVIRTSGCAAFAWRLIGCFNPTQKDSTRSSSLQTERLPLLMTAQRSLAKWRLTTLLQNYSSSCPRARTMRSATGRRASLVRTPPLCCHQS
jgi:hypothetical protein